MTLSSIIDEARKLSPEEQADLLDELLRLVGPGADDAPLLPGQREDLLRRDEEYRSGKATLIPGEQAFAELRNRT